MKSSVKLEFKKSLLKEELLSYPIVYPHNMFKVERGVGKTSQRSRERLIEVLIEKGISNLDVLKVIRITPRHLFIDDALSNRAYEDISLPIGYGQTLSRPWVVAKMCEFLFADGRLDSVLEIGTGSGYQAVVLSQLSNKVYGVERVAPLFQKAKSVLDRLKIRTVKLALGDGSLGYEIPSPFDGIIAAAAPSKIPEELFEQLKEGGRLVIPVGEKEQHLYGFKKTSTGIKKECLGEVLFVPMLSGIMQGRE